jgi:hypothetical protein
MQGAPVTRDFLAGDSPADLVVSSDHDMDCAWLAGILAPLLPDIAVEALVSSRPLFWTRIVSPLAVDAAEVRRRIAAGGVAVRYVVSARSSNALSMPPLDCTRTAPLRPGRWKTRGASELDHAAATEPWFLGDEGLAVDRRWCGGGAGTRLAVIDDDAGLVERLDLDAEVPVGVSTLPRGSHHGACMVAWAVSTARSASGQRFVGVAPDSAPRLYCIPLAGHDTISLPVAIVRAVDDGADVVVCAHPWVWAPSPLLDDALEYAARCGRMGRGTPVLFPAALPHPGESGMVEIRGPRVSPIHARLVVAAPRDHTWRGVPRTRVPGLRRGGVRVWLAPGENLEQPFADSTAPVDASVAAAVAAGAVLLVLGRNPNLTLPELDELLACTRACPPTAGAWYGPEPPGYGRIHAMRACLGAQDPVALTLIVMGDEPAALRYLGLRQRETELGSAYSRQLAAWAARVVLCDAELDRTLRALGRYARLAVRHTPEATAGSGRAWLERVAACLGHFHRAAIEWPAGPDGPGELSEVVERVRLLLNDRSALDGRILWERAVRELGRQLWPSAEQSTAERLASVSNPA